MVDKTNEYYPDLQWLPLLHLKFGNIYYSATEYNTRIAPDHPHHTDIDYN